MDGTNRRQSWGNSSAAFWWQNLHLTFVRAD
jgi:hypothetical protein